MKRALIHRRGITITELLATLTIIGVMAGTMSLMLPQQAQQAREDQMRRDLALVRSALRSFYQDTGFYPDELNDLADSTAPTTARQADGNPGPGYDSRLWRGPYLSQVPVDAVSGAPFTYVPGDSGFVRSSATGTDRQGVAFSSY